MAQERSEALGYPRGFWQVLAAPGVLWLLALFVLPLYGVLSVAMGTRDPIFFAPVPVWNPVRWQADNFRFVWEGFAGENALFRAVFVRTLGYIGISVTLSLLLGYAVAYYIARVARRTRGILLVLLLAPFWISYLMRMFAWVNLLQDDGYINRILEALGILQGPYNWLNGKPLTVVFGLVYGYVPFMILPLFAALDRIDRNLLEAARDLGASPARAFVRVTLPLSKQGILAGAAIITLPMFGDFYTEGLLSGTPNTSMIGTQISFYITGAVNQGAKGAALVVVLSALVSVLMVYYLIATARAAKEVRR